MRCVVVNVWIYSHWSAPKTPLQDHLHTWSADVVGSFEMPICSLVLWWLPKLGMSQIRFTWVFQNQISSNLTILIKLYCAVSVAISSCNWSRSCCQTVDPDPVWGAVLRATYQRTWFISECWKAIKNYSESSEKKWGGLRDGDSWLQNYCCCLFGQFGHALFAGLQIKLDLS